jgi:hypothetical protein
MKKHQMDIRRPAHTNFYSFPFASEIAVRSNSSKGMPFRFAYNRQAKLGMLVRRGSTSSPLTRTVGEPVQRLSVSSC